MAMIWPDTPTRAIGWQSATVASLSLFATAAAMPLIDGPQPILPNEVIRLGSWGNLSIDVHPVWSNLQAVQISDPIVDHYQPRTELGRRLLSLRRAYIEGGGRLLSQDEVLDDIRRLRSE
jgi:hypothetical protein